ncbi:hypothetical protein CLOM_g17703 [Closterium sp. NIES-68]|nr:hypothetical protein CLOM_g17703 [Closterium sp. NIES-68]
MVSGILGLSTAHSWVVTQKLGNWVQTDAATAKTGLAKYLGKAGAIPHSLSLPVISESLVKQGAEKTQPKNPKSSRFNRTIYKRELGMAAFIFGAGIYAIFVEDRWDYSIFLFLQSIAFAMFGLNFVDRTN